MTSFKVFTIGMFMFLLACNPARPDKNHQDIVREYFRGKNASDFTKISGYLHEGIVYCAGEDTFSSSLAELYTKFQWDSVFFPEYTLLDLENKDGAVVATISKECERIRFLHDSAIVYKNLYEFKDNQISKITELENLVFDVNTWTSRRDSLVVWIDDNHPELTGFIYDQTRQGAKDYLEAISYYIQKEFQEYSHHNLTREYIYYAPTDLPAGAPLVFVLHGYTGDALSIKEYSGMSNVADEHGFAVCFPRGTIDDRDNRFWNVGYDFHNGVSVDDVDFLIQLAAHLQKEYKLSPENTFVTGMSNGGEMSYLLACRAPSVFKAAAPVAGMMLQSFFENCDSAHPVPVFEIHGTADSINRYGGDIMGKDGWGAYPDIPFTIDYWVKANACKTVQVDTLPDINAGDDSFVISEKYLDGINGNQVWLYKVVNGGHDWPGSSGNMDIESSREIWRFFSMFIAD